MELTYLVAGQIAGLFGDDVDDVTFTRMVDDEVARRLANAGRPAA